MHVDWWNILLSSSSGFCGIAREVEAPSFTANSSNAGVGVGSGVGGVSGAGSSSLVGRGSMGALKGVVRSGRAV